MGDRAGGRSGSWWWWWLPAAGCLALAACGHQVGDTRSFPLPTGARMEFVWIGPGRFTMGTAKPETTVDPRSTGEVAQFTNEQPLHNVTLTRGFWLGKYEVTQAQWVAVMGSNPSEFPGENRPVTMVAWNDAQEFVVRLNQAAGTDAYRLPTEAEWEYACRAGRTTRWSFGDDPNQLGAFAWFLGNSPGGTREVGGRAPNPWGLYDMHGNAWEWVQDWYEAYPEGPQTDPSGPASGTIRVYRGGGWDRADAAYFRSACRGGLQPDLRYGLGFRLARTGR